MTIVVVAVTGLAADLGGFQVEHRNDGMIRHAFAFHAMIVKNVAQAEMIHRPYILLTITTVAGT